MLKKQRRLLIYLSIALFNHITTMDIVLMFFNSLFLAIFLFLG